MILSKLLLLMLIVPAAAIGQGNYTIQGHLVLEGFAALESVRIRLDGLRSGYGATAYTNAAGAFQFTNVPQGTYYLVVDQEGLEQTRERVILPQTGGIWLWAKRKIEVSDEEPAIGGRHMVDVRQLSIPADVIRNYEKARNDMKEGESDRAVERLKRVIDTAPKFYEAAIQLARIHIDRKQYVAAIDILESHVPENAGIPGAHFYLGYALYHVERYAAAEEALLQSLEEDPQMHGARLMLANVSMKRGDLRKAIEHIDAYLETNITDSERIVAEGKRSELINFLAQ